MHPLVLAIPRGAVPMDALITSALGDQLNVVLVCRLGAPFDPKLTIGSMEEGGQPCIAPYAGRIDASTTYLEQESTEQMEVIRRCRALYIPNHDPYDAEGRVVIVADDGLATGASMKVALHAIQEYHPQHLVCAVPVTTPDSLGDIRPLANEIVCLCAPQGFRAVDMYHADFPQVEDAEMRAALKAALQTEHRAG